MMVGSAVKGSKNAVGTSAFKSISDLLIGCHLSIEEPSKGKPFVKFPSFTALIL